MTQKPAVGLRTGFILLVILVSVAGGLSTPAAGDATCSDYPIHSMTVQPGTDSPLTAVQLSADTRLSDTDTLGYNPGEPYIQLDIDGEEVVQTGLVERTSKYQTTLQLPENHVDALDPGTHTVTAIVWDMDGDSIDQTDYGNDDPVCEATKTFEVEEQVTSEIQSVEIENQVDTDGDGYYSAFHLNIRATTVLDDSDTSGNNPGEPYFRVTIGDEVVTTTNVVERGEGKLYQIGITERDLTQFTHGQKDIEVELWDKDGDSIDETNIGRDEKIDEWTSTVGIEQPLRLRSSRSSTTVGSPVSFQLTGATGSEVSWQITSQPAGSDASLYTEYRHTASFRPTTPGQYSITATPEESNVTKSATISVSESDDSKLLSKYAPRIHYDAEEQYHPTRYEAFIYHSKLQQFGADNIPHPTVFDLSGKENWELELDGSSDDYPTYQEDYPPAVYGSVHENVQFRGESYTAATYWLFYTYDPKKADSIGELFAHQSDLETVTILLQDGNPELVGASQHYGGELREWSATPTNKSHLNIYPALGAHSNYLRNTENYADSGIPIQQQFLFEDSTNTSVLDVVEYFDETGSDTVYAQDSTGDIQYQLIPLTGSEAWADYEGTLGPNDDAGALPFDRTRWRNPGHWMETRLPEDEQQFEINVLDGDVTVGAETIQSSMRLANEGAKPHPAWIVAEAKPTTARWEGSQTVTLSKKPVFVGVGETVEATIETQPPESGGTWNTRIRVAAYPPSAGDAVDIFAQLTADQTITVKTPTPTATPTVTASPMGSGSAEPNPPNGKQQTATHTITGTPSATGPGFGVAVAIASIILLIGITRLR